jgi:hypothetical protein
VEDTSGVANIFTFGATVIFLGGAFVTWWAWMFDVFSVAMKTIRKPDVPSDDTRIVEAIKGMDANQVWLTAYYLGYDVDPEHPEEPTLDPEGEVTKSYAISKINKAERNQGYLEPVRKFSDGTKERRAHEFLTNYLVKEGYAEPAVGPKPTRVIDPQAARRRILE